MKKHGSYYGNIFSGTVKGFRGLNQGVSERYHLDEERVRELENFDVIDFTLRQRNGCVPFQQVTACVNGVFELDDVLVLGFGTNIGILA